MFARFLRYFIPWLLPNRGSGRKITAQPLTLAQFRREWGCDNA